MTEKRYNRLVSSIDYYYCTDNQNENQGLTEKDMLNRLNEQDDLINALREELELTDKENTSLAEENEKLKQQLKTKVIINKQYEELQNLKNQIKIYELFLDQNDLNIEWDLFCTLNYCVNEEDTGCQTCKYMGLVDGDLDD